MNNLDMLVESIRSILEQKNNVRESLISQSRQLVQHCGKAIRAMHRQEWDEARVLLSTARMAHHEMRTASHDHPDLYYAGYSQDSFKEYVEAELVFALLRGDIMPTLDELGVEAATYLNGMAEAASELRRYILDIIRADLSGEAERLLTRMESFYDTLVTFDFPDAVSGGLRHRADNLRGVLERTRGDVTLSLRQQRLEAVLSRADQMNQKE